MVAPAIGWIIIRLGESSARGEPPSPPIERSREVRSYVRDSHGPLAEVGQTTVGA